MTEQGHTPRPEVITVNFTVSGIVRVLCVLAAAATFWRLMDLVMLVLIAFVVASAILPLALRLEKRVMPPVWTVNGVFVLVLAGVSVLSILTAPAIGAPVAATAL